VQLSLREQAELAGPAGDPLLPDSCDVRARPKYDWMDRIIAVGTGGRPADGQIYNIFEVL
jgi:hypothetical protein